MCQSYMPSTDSLHMLPAAPWDLPWDPAVGPALHAPSDPHTYKHRPPQGFQLQWNIPQASRLPTWLVGTGEAHSVAKFIPDGPQEP